MDLMDLMNFSIQNQIQIEKMENYNKYLKEAKYPCKDVYGNDDKCNIPIKSNSANAIWNLSVKVNDFILEKVTRKTIRISPSIYIENMQFCIQRSEDENF